MKKRIIGLFLSLAILIPLKIVLSAGCCNCASTTPCNSGWVSTQIYLLPEVIPNIPNGCYSGALLVDALTDYIELNQGFDVVITVQSGGCGEPKVYTYGSPDYSVNGAFTILVPDNEEYNVVVELRAPCECGTTSEGSNQRMVWRSSIHDELLVFGAQEMPGNGWRGKYKLNSSNIPTTDHGCGGVPGKPSE